MRIRKFAMCNGGSSYYHQSTEKIIRNIYFSALSSPQLKFIFRHLFALWSDIRINKYSVLKEEFDFNMALPIESVDNLNEQNIKKTEERQNVLKTIGISYNFRLSSH